MRGGAAACLPFFITPARSKSHLSGGHVSEVSRRCLRSVSASGVSLEVANRTRQTRRGAISRLHLGYLSATPRLSLGYLSAISRLHLGYLSAISRLSLGYISAISRLSLGYLSAISPQIALVKHDVQPPLPPPPAGQQALHRRRRPNHDVRASRVVGARLRNPRHLRVITIS